MTPKGFKPSTRWAFKYSWEKSTMQNKTKFSSLCSDEAKNGYALTLVFQKNGCCNGDYFQLGYCLKKFSLDGGFFSPSFTTFSKDLIVRYNPSEGVQIKMKAEINDMIRAKSFQVFMKNRAM